VLLNEPNNLHRQNQGIHGAHDYQAGTPQSPELHDPEHAECPKYGDGPYRAQPLRAVDPGGLDAGVHGTY
jgi:hypothetical protein